MALLALRYDLRTTERIGAPHGALYAAALEQSVWADRLGLDAIVLSEHHFTEDGYLPSPLVMAAAVAGRTGRIAITVAALLVPLHDPLRLAEDIAVLDHVSGGRVSIVAGLGYRPEEFAALGVDRSRRGSLLEEHVHLLRRAWNGEPVERCGTTVQVRPLPATPGGPLVFVGGSTPAAARRAARLGAPFYPAIDDPDLLATYDAENQRLGNAPGFSFLPAGPTFVHISDDPERDWATLAPHMLRDAATYRAWQTPGQRSIVESAATTAEELQAEGKYRVVTPKECVALVRDLDPMATFVLHPLMGGIAPELAWASLELFAKEVLPELGEE